MSRISVIALEQIPPMAVIETLDVEVILAARMARLVALWQERDPPAAANYDVDMLEFDPIKINQEASTFFETLVRDRVNQAARAVTTAFGYGSDLDAIASRYPGGVPRLALVADPRPYIDHPEDWEADGPYRRRIWLSSNLLSPHGSYEAYIFWALTADPTLHDASAVTTPGTGKIKVTILADDPLNPAPSAAQLNTVLAYILDESRKGLTDVVTVAPPIVKTTDYRIRVWLYPGFDQDAVLTQVNTALAALIEKQRWLGFDHTRMAIDAAMAQPGVYNAIVDAPAEDVIVNEDGYVKVNSVTVTMVGRGE